MTTLYFIRHGKTEWNQEGRFQGANGDSPLLPESYEQIKQLAHHLAPIPFKHAFSSPIKRAVDTAEATLAAMHQDVPLTLLPGLKEFGMGVWEGMRFEDVKRQYHDMHEAYRHQPDLFDADQVPGAESFEHVQERFVNDVKATVQQYGGPDVNLIYFSHGMALTAGMGALLQVPLSDVRKEGGLSNTSTSILETDDGEHYREVVRNDVSYLGGTQDETNTV
ncbi:Fructose-2,6-bisphosphatase [Weissella viridescens]|uniref:Phosphoglycerate mutase n=1 Tax=Weissella viridescens TaxID=1629 RepID=A0A0R2H057_WEIVI|nr:histidine phosphatase family protein [Weissella viridescens]KRN46088.1 phosphoglycerate mutase [Weissella viridescens]MBX4172693.1 histidine phosphatase family protein [Weissella viridescens]QOD86550.1 histidine phosphatase family protein [Weissella viridescens]SOB44404.1 Fructose-2,6-bisphosphatase [Weissella viridescens]GEA94954.1 phosphoglycerate mutase [Weissella viridescens]